VEEKALEKCIDHMAAQNLIASRALGTISITHEGIKRFEKLLENRARTGRASKNASLIRRSINNNEMSNVLEIQRLRADILKQAFNSSTRVVNLFEIGGPLGINNEKLERIYFFLQDEGLIDFYALGGDFVLTEKGKVVLEKNPKRIL
jgi:predicted transcriptional regulator